MTRLAIKQMSLPEKLRAMEELWESLGHEEERLESPAWHGDVLKETQERYEKGLEKPIDWESAKEELRK